MTRYEAEKEIRRILPDAWVKQRRSQDEFVAMAYAKAGIGKWVAVASTEEEAWSSLVVQVLGMGGSR